ncbi:MAG: hypothetical protein RLZZ59_878 [Pseudomonadota bacterium]|jgi:cytoskeletal protein RodZ
MDTNNIGEMFKDARARLGLSIDEVSKMLNVRRQYITALENNDIASMPSGVYLNGYKKLYSRLLGLNYEEFESGIPKTNFEAQESVVELGRVPILISITFVILAMIWGYVSFIRNKVSSSNIIDQVSEAAPDQHLTNIVAPQIIVPYSDCTNGICNDSDSKEEE